VRLRGRIASLLEVGTGFHPELTGRENIFLNGAILGMSRREIRKKFEEIVVFAEVEKFLDTPVKHFSSGMYVRLAFAVAAHLEPEILIIDEVLAVGDAEFQKKCLGKMSEVAVGGRTVLLVSHNLAAITRICKRAIILASGRLQGTSDDVEQTVSSYLNQDRVSSTWLPGPDDRSNEYFVPLEFTADAQSSDSSDKSDITIRVLGQLRRNHLSLNIAVGIYSGDGSLMFLTTPRDLHPDNWMSASAGLVEVSVRLPTGILNEGDYYAELSVMLHNRMYIVPPGAGPKVHFSTSAKITHSEFWDQRRPGYLAPILPWDWQQSLSNHKGILLAGGL
jgi:lipopolysaccharide transport system ATP-binding protein